MKNPHHLWRYVLGGALVTVTFSILYICFGEWFLGSPQHRWAEVLLFPGLVTGHLSYPHLPIPLCFQVGVATMGLVGGLIGLALHWVIRLARGSRRGPSTGRS